MKPTDVMDVVLLVLTICATLFLIFAMGYMVWGVIESERNIRRMRKKHEEMEARVEQAIRRG